MLNVYNNNIISGQENIMCEAYSSVPFNFEGSWRAQINANWQEQCGAWPVGLVVLLYKILFFESLQGHKPNCLQPLFGNLTLFLREQDKLLDGCRITYRHDESPALGKLVFQRLGYVI